ncbi:hypothetical protein KP509_38G063400 [Ceratopteris richardii]|uniref:Uncharacterized protein n=1 Tax=Ceratopteris richardii TaxID=49495 RepID=A0A8T2Q4Q4_CERRI|nr:hypothetical protein KP509_38G063400 [Ceratopteris richardii]
MELRTTLNATSRTNELWIARRVSQPSTRMVITHPSRPSKLSLPFHARSRISIRCEADHSLPTEGSASQSEFCKVEAILRPWRLSHVTAGLVKVGIRGVTVSDVRGFGAQGGARERQAGSEFGEDSFVSKVRLEVVISKDQVDTVIQTIIDHARTGEIGDGKIFVSPVTDVIRVRTGERGLKAEKMVGGRTDLLSLGGKVI